MEARIILSRRNNYNPKAVTKDQLFLFPFLGDEGTVDYETTWDEVRDSTVIRTSFLIGGVVDGAGGLAAIDPVELDAWVLSNHPQFTEIDVERSGDKVVVHGFEDIELMDVSSVVDNTEYEFDEEEWAKDAEEVDFIDLVEDGNFEPLLRVFPDLPIPESLKTPEADTSSPGE